MADSDRFKLFVGGLSRETDDVALREHFSKYGEVGQCVVAHDRDTGERRGFGFVTFSDSVSFDRALEDVHVILQRRVDVKRAIPRCEQLRNKNYTSNGFTRNVTNNNSWTPKHSQCSTKKIFVGGLPPNLTENEFKSYFEQFGRITDVVVMYDNATNRPRGFGFITFESEESVESVMRKNFHELGGKLAEVKRAVPKDHLIGTVSHSPRVENGINTVTNNQFGYVPYSDPYNNLPIYRPIALGYPYVPPTPFGHGPPLGGFYGVSYEMASPVMSLSPLLGGVSTLYPTYLNAGVGILGTPNGALCNNFANLGLYKDPIEFVNGYGQMENRVLSVQIREIESNGVTTNVVMG